MANWQDSLWRRIFRRHCFKAYRYADNLLRMPMHTVAWRIYNRLWTPRAMALSRKLGLRRQPSPRQWSRALGGKDPLVHAREWLEGKGEPSFFTSWSDVRKVAAAALARDGQGTDRTIEMAEAFLRGEFRLLEAKPAQKIALPFDWQANPLNDVEWPHALNRFRGYARALGRAYLYTGKQEYADFLLNVMEDWIEQNPRGTPISWLSMETSLRLIEWCWALHLLGGCPSLTPERLVRIWGSMMLQARHMASHPEIEISDNHLIYNLGSLCLLSCAFPFLVEPADRDWAQKEYVRQLHRQHRGDGMNAEQSTHYFIQVARLYIETYWLNRRLGRSWPQVETFVKLFVDDIAGLLRPDGTVPLFSDAFTSFFETSAARDAQVLLGWAAAVQQRGDLKSLVNPLPEGAVWLLADQVDQFDSIAPATPSRNFVSMPQSGYFITRDKWTADGSYGCVDAGPMGFDPVPAHGHPDTLSFEWYHRGRPVVVDPGTYEYEPGEWAYYFRRTRAHATVTIDGLDQSTQWGFARWVDMPVCRTLAYGGNEGALWCEAEHNGYARLNEPVFHRRRLAMLLPDLVVIEDLLTGEGEHLIEQTFPLHPSVQCAVDGEGFVLRPQGASGGPLLLESLISPQATQILAARGQSEPIIWGFHASNYGVREPSSVAVFRARARVPARFLTILAAASQVRAEAPGQWRVAMADGTQCVIQAAPSEGFNIVEIKDGLPARALAGGMAKVTFGGQVLLEAGPSRWAYAARTAQGWSSFPCKNSKEKLR